MTDLEKRADELEETNADLKQSLDWANERESEDVKRIAELEKENESLVNIKNIYIGDLLKAKKIISEYINILKGDTKNWKKTQEKAEQFLSEVEK